MPDVVGIRINDARRVWAGSGKRRQRVVTDWVPDADHLLRQAGQPVRFDLVLAAASGCELLEVSPSARCSTRSIRRASWPISFRPRLVGPPSPPRPPNPVERSSPAGPPRRIGRGSPPTCGTSSHASSR
ncbi:hypothetical protein [Saccharothrix coeruleofusca]|uniref:Uncharacterized protein n=1 Tax=Saccharothrix coeruleofusca TaxID=33919 RepID=A0A918EBN8_9PSEU|nr:hypothetical protein [Saccharothrix coeruleofusca]GGP34031.1 hypothetical protein GCM10010185_00550 [Saccharothrix coeruleofusca]